MKRPLDGPMQPGDSQPASKLDRPRLLQANAGMRQVLQQGRALAPPSTGVTFDFAEQERRLDELDALLKKNDPADDARIVELQQDLALYFEAEIARVMGPLEESLVRFTDEVARRAEEKKFEMTGEQREGLEELLDPYHDRFREEMLGRMPIETRREIEEEKRRRAEGDAKE